MNKPLELNEGRDLINAVNKLNALSAQKILTKTSDAEKAGLDSYVRTALYEHASVLLACWFAVRTEYEPLINSVGAILNRVNGMKQLHEQAVAAAAEKEEAPRD